MPAFEQTPLPPRDLAQRVLGERVSDPVAQFDIEGWQSRELILELLPEGWSFEGKRILDFGCGAGKVLRTFLAEAESAEFYGCDVHADSVAWLERHFSPPLRVFVNGEAPPLPFPDGHLDLVWAWSVFTHLTDHWSAWLAELHRVIADDGLLLATFMGQGLAEAVSGESWSEDRVGMNVFEYGAGFESGDQGPMVLHSPWWIATHWGRAFEILHLEDGAAGEHDNVVLRKRPVAVTVDELERIEPDEPREAIALHHQVKQLRRELRSLRRHT
jgi:SAM-dependent methyltransferase